LTPDITAECFKMIYLRHQCILDVHKTDSVEPFTIAQTFNSL